MRSMIKIISILIIITYFYFCTNQIYAKGNEEVIFIKTKITSIIDLETIEIKGNHKIKLYGVNSDYYKIYLEKFKEGHLYKTDLGLSAAYFKGESIEKLVDHALNFYANILIGKEVYLVKIPSSQSYIVYLDKEKKQSLNELAVKYGFLEVSRNHQEIPSLLIEEEEAKVSKAGLWGITVYSNDKKGGVESNYIHFAVIALSLNFILCIIIYWHYIKSRNLIGMLAVYGTFLTTNLSVIYIYESNEEKSLFWFPPLIVIILTFIGVIEFLLFIRSTNERKLWYVTLEILMFVLVVIVGFSSIYQGYSNNARKQSEIAYSLPDYEYAENLHISKPEGDYITLPENEFKTIEIDRNMKLSDYYLTTKNALYFSAVTFFTVGYGDFSPKGFLKMISIMQMFIGYLSQVILFSLVISKVSSAGRISSIIAKTENAKSSLIIPSRKSRKKTNQKLSKEFRLTLFLIILAENVYIIFNWPE